MKSIKLSKTSWLILSAGVFIVVLAGLGVTRNQQMQQQSIAQEQLDLAETRLAKYDLTQLRYRVEELSRLIEEKKTEVEEAQKRLESTVVSADVVEQFYAIAEFSDVTVSNVSDTPISNSNLSGVGVQQTSLSSSVNGTLENIMDFIINLNHNFTTGYTVTAQIRVDGIPDDDDMQGAASCNLQVFVYSREVK